MKIKTEMRAEMSKKTFKRSLVVCEQVFDTNEKPFFFTFVRCDFCAFNNASMCLLEHLSSSNRHFLDKNYQRPEINTNKINKYV